MFDTMKKISKWGLVSSLLFVPSLMWGADSDLPLLMTLKTNIYGYQGPTNSFTIYLGATENDTEVYVESPTSEEYISVGPWSLGENEEGDKVTTATQISITVTESNNEVKIYGDKSKIDFIDVHGCYLSAVTLDGEFPNLAVIDLSHNELTEIDLSAQTSLASIDLTDNAFTDASKMVIGTNHPGLLILSVGINDVCDPNLDLTNFPNLQYFSARNNYGVYSVDPTQCPQLVSLVLEITNVSSVDVSNCPLLDVLNLSQTRINQIDVSKNTRLGELYINHEGSFNNEDQYRLSSIDLSNNPMLQYLDLGGNSLSSIDLSNNSDLRLLYLQRNNLSSIDVSNLKKLAVFNISNNNFTFATLPIPEDGWDYYYYRAGLPTDFKYMVGDPIDFSSSVIRAPFTDAQGNTITPVTYAAVFAEPKAEEIYEVDESAYTYNNGIITFNEALPDSVFVQFYCDVFPDWPLNTQKFMVKTAAEFDAPSAAFTFTPLEAMAGQQISFSVGATRLNPALEYPADVTVTIGNEVIKLAGVVNSKNLPEMPNVSFTLPSQSEQVSIALPDGFAISQLSIQEVGIKNIDLSSADNLEILRLNGCELSNIDLGYNRELRELDLSNNNLSTLNLAGVRGDYEKYSLSNLILSNNNLRSLNLVTYEFIRNLVLDHNYFKEFDLKYFTGLQNLDLSYNILSGAMDFSTVAGLNSLNIRGNKVSELIFNTEEGALDNLEEVIVDNNNFTFATLPLFTGIDQYVYAPQAKIEILSMAPAINLSAQNVMVNGQGSTFVWKYAEDNTVVPSDQYSMENGATVFNESLAGSTVYCEITNPAFPDFNANPLSTENVTVSSKPENLVATFTTTQDGVAEIGFRFYKSGDNAVYIDWRGNGTEYEPYIYEASQSYPSIYRTGTTYAGATVKVYSYDPADNISVFAMNQTPLESMDLSPMTMLSAVNIHSAGLTDGNLILPESQELFELVLDGNAFTEAPLCISERISNLNLADNELVSIDLSPYPMLGFAQLSNNKISSVKFNPEAGIIQLDLTNNNLKTLDLSDVDYLSELLVSDNSLRELDLTPVASSLRTLVINGNYFTFATLPDTSVLGDQFTTYYYGNQKPMDVECEDWKIDLSAQAYVNDVATEFYWFLGDYQNEVYYDAETESFVGESLEGPQDSADPEYIIEDGVTTFLYPQTRSVICAMVNSEYPSLILYTSPTRVTGSGVESLGMDDNRLQDVYTLSGVRIKKGVSVEEALKGLDSGIYIIGGKKVRVK